MHFRALADELLHLGHSVVVLTDGKRFKGRKRVGNLEVYSWQSKRPTTIKDALFLIQLIREYHPDCIIGNFGSVNVMMLIGWFMRVKTRLAWYHTLASAIDLDSSLSRWVRTLLRFRKRFVYRIATHIIANSEASSADVQAVFHVPSRKIMVFPNSLVDPLAEAQSILQLQRNANKFVCVGRLSPSKGQDVLLKAAALLSSLTPLEFYVEFLGDGPSRPELERIAHGLGMETRCIFRGSVSHDEVLRTMASAVATVVPSRSEAFGVVNIESLAVGTPVIASSVGGIPEIVRDKIDGFLFLHNDSKKLAEKLHLLLSKSNLRAAMRRNARERFLDCFERQKVVGQQAAWLQQTITGSEIRQGMWSEVT
jgi:glycosyltransferase involved in cell wall biosynthesis